MNAYRSRGARAAGSRRPNTVEESVEREDWNRHG